METEIWIGVRNTCSTLSKHHRDLVEAVNALHKASPNGGHDMWHDLTVAHFAVGITPGTGNYWLEKVAWIAGILHSLDLLLPAGQSVESKLRELLAEHTQVDQADRLLVTNAMMKHDGKNENETLLLQILQEADRLANLMLSVAFRSGAFSSTIPPVELDLPCDWDKDPRGDYRSPPTVFKDVWNCLDWDPDHGDERFKIRLPKAIPVARGLVKQLREFLIALHGQYVTLGLTKDTH